MVPGVPLLSVDCWYPVFGAKGPRPPTRTITVGLQLHRLIELLNSLRSPMKPGTYSCPLDRGNAVDLSFRYEDGTTQIVHVELSGCSVASNGKRIDWIDARLRRFLARIAPHA
jgi:hypothetical protein